jgi:hypothetical protein
MKIPSRCTNTLKRRLLAGIMEMVGQVAHPGRVNTAHMGTNNNK